MPSFAESDTTPTIKEMIEKRAKQGQPTEQAPEGAHLEVPDDPLGRGVPRSSVRGFLTTARNRNYAQAAEYLDLRNLPTETAKTQGPELARQLKIVLDRVLWIDLDLLSAKPEGDRDDNLHPARDRVGSISVESKTYEILLQRVPREDGVFIWQFAGVTVAEIPQLYKEFGYGPLERIFPAWLFDVTVLGVHLWLWIMLLGMAILLYPVAMLITWLIAFILRRLHADLAQQLEQFFTGPVGFLIWTVLVRSASEMVGPSIAVRAIGQARTLQLVALVWLLLRIVDFVAHRTSDNLDRKGLAGALVVLKPVARLIKALAITTAVLLWLDNIGFKVTTLLAGLSISGIAVALASQKTLENIFGAFTLFAAQPVRVGDFCRFGPHLGTVEEIGLRATRIRTPERSVISIANAEFANMHLDNLSARDRFLFNPKLNLRYETTPDQIRYILVEVQQMLYGHPKVLSEPMWVRFLGFGDSSITVGIFAYIGVTDSTESLEIAEDLNLRLMDIVAAAGTDFALPAAPRKPFDEARAQAIEAQVKEWKASRALYLPTFPKEKIAQVKGSLDYPPQGSPHYSPARV